MTKPRVHILATCRSPELSCWTELVFHTLRVGFPTAAVTVHINGDCLQACPKITQLCTDSGCNVVYCNTIHHDWIESLVTNESEPFFILDTDVIFYKSFEGFDFRCNLAGWRIPEWQDEFSGAITRSRLHTSLLYIDPAIVKANIFYVIGSFANTVFTPKANLFKPLCTCLNARRYFNDTCSLLYHAIGGQPFTPEQLDCYFHFNFGTIPDIVLPHLSNAEQFQAERQRVLENPELGRGRWREQMEYYQLKPPVVDGKDVIAPLNNGDAAEALKWNVELCRGNNDAMAFCDLWYQYVHGIDDLIDTLEDGRPRMSREQMISLFLKAAVLYNCKFFVQHRDLLFPVVIQITNAYADSVAWEQSSKPHLRLMGDVLRTCGNDMYVMVALLCGGEAHMRKMSAAIKERDFVLQHDSNGNPT